MEKVEDSLNCREKLAPYIVDPMNSYKVAWDIIIGLVYLEAYTIDPYILAFHHVGKSLRHQSNLIAIAILIDIFATPFVGVIRKENILPIKKKTRGDVRLL